MANHLLEQTLPAEAAEFARYYQNGLRAASPEEQMLRALARAVTKGFLDFEDAVGSLLELSAGRLAVSQPASARADTEALLRSLGRAVAENLLDFETAAEVIAERQLDDLKAEPASAHAQLGRLFATGEIRAADLEPLWFEIEGRQVANTEDFPDPLYAKRDAFIDRLLAAADAYTEQENTAREQAEDRLISAIEDYDAATERQHQTASTRLQAAVDAYKRGAADEPTTAEPPRFAPANFGTAGDRPAPGQSVEMSLQTC